MDSKSPELLLDEATYRSAAYGLFTNALRRPEPSNEEWINSDLLKGLSELAARYNLAAMTADDIPTLQERQDEFNRLFESHGQMLAPPYETEYIKDWPQHALIQSTILADIQGFYRAFGLEIGSHCAERCDHVRLELEFLHFLALKEAIAIDRGEKEHFDVVRNAQKKFLEDHAIRWPLRFADRLREQKALPFYQLITDLLAHWITEDAETLCDKSFPPCQTFAGEAP